MSTALAQLHKDLRDLVGTTIAGRYRVEALVGIGGMAAVFRAHHCGLKRDVAVKVLHPELVRDPDASARFDREARSASRLDHVNCVQVTDFGSTEAGLKYMVLQFLEGRELADVLGTPLGSIRAIDFTVQILRGLRHAHSHGVIHRDVKPENVFVTHDHDRNEVLKIVDFGIAKIVGEGGDSHKTRAGLVFGTPAYMSPEQAAGSDVDERADLYSVGVMFYQMLAGHPPFQHDDPVTLVRMQVTREAPPLPASTPPVLAAVAQRLLAKDRDDRFPSADEVIAALTEARRAVAAGEFETLRTGGHMVTMSDVGGDDADWPARRSRWSGWVLAAAVVLAGGWATWRVWGPDEAIQASSTLPSPISSLAQALPGSDDDDEVATPDPGALGEIDALIGEGKLDDADKLLTPLRDQYPGSAQLMWRQGRLLAKQRRKLAQALAAYSQALQADPQLVDDEQFFAELSDLLVNPRIRDEALDLALRHLGERSYGFLLEWVNDERKPLAYHDRHRALEQLANDADLFAKVDRRLNNALDVLQAHQSLTPCTAYREALQAIDNDLDPYYRARLERAELPTREDAAESPASDDAHKCDGLAEERDRLLAALMTPEERAQALADAEQAEESKSTATKPASKSKKTTTKRKKKPKCRRGIFGKRCRR